MATPSRASFRRAALIVNTRARRGEAEAGRARELLRAFAVPVAMVRPVRAPGRLAAAAREALAAGCDLIVLGGGDGSVGAVAGALANTGAALALLPLGTANDFARTLGNPTALPEACAAIASGAIIDVDLGRAGDRPFVNVASAGLAVAVTKALSPGLKRRAGALAYPLAAIRAFLGHRPFAATLTFPAGDHPPVRLERLLQVAVGNGRFYGGGLAVAPRASIDDQALDIYAIALGRPRNLLGVLRYLRSGDFITNECVHSYRTTAIRVATAPPLPLAADGEPIGCTPETFAIAPKALRVLVPAASPAAARVDGPPHVRLVE